MKEEMTSVDDTTIQLGVSNQQSFYEAFPMFGNQSIEKSLMSESILARIFMILDRRVGKRRLGEVRQGIEGEEKMLREFFVVRATAEGMTAEEEHEG